MTTKKMIFFFPHIFKVNKSGEGSRKKLIKK